MNTWLIVNLVMIVLAVLLLAFVKFYDFSNPYSAYLLILPGMVLAIAGSCSSLVQVIIFLWRHFKWNS